MDRRKEASQSEDVAADANPDATLTTAVPEEGFRFSDPESQQEFQPNGLDEIFPNSRPGIEAYVDRLLVEAGVPLLPRRHITRETMASKEQEVEATLAGQIPLERLREMFAAETKLGIKQYRSKPRKVESRDSLAAEVFPILGGMNLNFVAIPTYSSAFYRSLSDYFVALLESKLEEVGLSEAESVQLGYEIILAIRGRLPTEFNEAVRAADLIAASVRVVRARSSFEKAAVSLPPDAPEKWAERDKSKGENPITFLNRVWGDYIKAGVLYQDDIKRLGDDKLVRAVHSFCQKHPEHTATDVLPPPRRVRLERALAAAPPDSPEAAAIRTRLAMREAGQRARDKKRQAAPKP